MYVEREPLNKFLQLASAHTNKEFCSDSKEN